MIGGGKAKAHGGAARTAHAFRVRRCGGQGKRLERLERLDAVEKPWEPWQLRLELAAAPASGDVVARLERRGGRARPFRLGPVDLELALRRPAGDRRPNGSGKTTLIQALLGELPLAAGGRGVGPGVVVGELDQARARFDGDEPLLGRSSAASGLPAGEARTLLAKFGLGADDVAAAGARRSRPASGRARVARAADGRAA